MIKTVSVASLTLILAAGAAPALAQSGSPDWSGPYIGIYGSYLEPADGDNERLNFDRNFDGRFNDTVVTPAGADAFSTGFCSGQANSVSAASGCHGDKGGVEAGIRGGYDYQFGSFVVGGLVEISGTEVQDTVTGFSTTPAAYVFKRNLENLAAARLRVGYAFGDALVYGTGGYARGEMTNRFITSNTVNSFTATVDEDSADGWQAGGGLEYKLAPNLTVFGEYVYTSLEPGDFVVRFGPGVAPFFNAFILPPNTGGTDVQRSNDEFNLHAVRIGMNYRF